MSGLPKQKKSADEIAKLRETLGIQGAPPPEPPLPPPEPLAPFPTNAAIALTPPLPVVADLETSLPVSPAPETTMLLPSMPPPAKQVRSLKRSERLPQLTPLVNPAHSLGQAAAHELASKIVKSLRKSEQIPLTLTPQIHSDSALPSQRHSDQEIARLRRNEALSQQAILGPPPTRFGYLAWILPGYVVVVLGALLTYCYQLSAYFLCPCLGISLACAVLLLLKKPLFRHHAAFIAVMVLFVGIFSALYFIPQLRYGT